MSWAEGLEERLGRLSGSGALEACEVLRRLETELAAEVALKRREVDWLSTTSAELSGTEPEGSDRHVQLETGSNQVNNAWRRILTATDLRATRLRSIIQVN
jgi:nesprin-1